MDTKGNMALQGSVSMGISPNVSGFGISGSAYESVTNAPDISALDGPSYQIGGSVAAPVYVVPLMAGGDVNIIPNDVEGETYLGFTGNFGFGTPNAEIHVGWGETAILEGSQINLFDIAEDVCDRIAG